MEVKERIRREQAFHDRQARERAAYYRTQPNRLLVSAGVYLDHEPWIRSAMEKLGNVRGRRILDFGCGHGMAAVVLAGRGAQVTACDLSGGYLREARSRATANQVAVEFVQANGEYLPFADGTFDGIWGNAVLHHLDLKRAGPELKRILKPVGRAIFCEPWGGNALLNWARRHWAYPGKERTPEETPLNRSDLDLLKTIFPHMQVTGYQILSMVGRMIGRSPVVQALAWCDCQLLARLPWMQRWCRYVVVEL